MNSSEGLTILEEAFQTEENPATRRSLFFVMNSSRHPFSEAVVQALASTDGILVQDAVDKLGKWPKSHDRSTALRKAIHQSVDDIATKSLLQTFWKLRDRIPEASQVIDETRRNHPDGGVAAFAAKLMRG